MDVHRPSPSSIVQSIVQVLAHALAANINWSKLTFLSILFVLKRIQIYPKLQRWLVLSTVAREHVQVIRDTQKNCRKRLGNRFKK